MPTTLSPGPSAEEPVGLSMIMPVYNSEAYLPTAVESVLAQDLGDCELILVDDGSTDGSGALCDAYARTDPRVRTIHKPNGGMCQARNVALDLARGEYVGFIDNDDRVLPGVLGHALALAREHDADCVRFGRRMTLADEDGSVLRESVLLPERTEVLTGEDLFRHYRRLSFSEAVWTGIYRRALIRRAGLRFDERLRHGCEDRLFTVQLYGQARTAVLLREVGYVWQRRIGHSASVSLDENKLLGHEVSTAAEHDLMVRHGVNVTDPRYFAARMLSGMMTSLMDEAYAVAGRGWPDSVALYRRLRDLYLPYRDELRHMPLGLARGVAFRSVMARAYAVPYLCTRIARLARAPQRG